MIRGRITGSVVSTRKLINLVGSKFMEVEYLRGGVSESLIAVDLVGAGIGEEVLVVTGSSSLRALEKDAPADAVIVGIID
ncbi:MAG: EutN/CcmL family microcompartment protein [Clostridiales bacterium]|jgi:ethanolamine utilization protein EutN|nr:EutN/CcmL family microcompartment protein [Clostridiales bacterium]